MPVLVKELIDRCRELAQFSQRRRENIVTAAVDPLMKLFSQVHDSYVKRFVDLQQEVLKKPDQLKDGKLVQKLMAGTLLRSSQRQELEELIKLIKQTEIKNLSKAMLEYLCRKELSGDMRKGMLREAQWSNMTRTTLRDKLHRALLTSNDNKHPIHKLLDRIEVAIAEQQARHRKVMIQYYIVHKALRG